MKRMVTILFSLLLCTSVLLGQGRIRGKVTDLQTGEPLIGANVLIAGTSFGGATDVNGNYEIRNLNAGVYEVKASYVGYQSIVTSNVRVTTDLATDLNFQLPSEGISVAEIQVVAERPLIQKDNTNAIRTTTSEDINALPVRGVNSIVSLEAGVVEKDNAIFIRGGRIDEVGYYLEGTNITNPVVGGRAVTLSQDAIEEIQVQAGGYTAEFGGANAGIIRQTLKTGGSSIKASVEYITDNIGFKSKSDFHSGDKRLGAYWFGYNELSAVVSGPVFDPRFRFFANVNYVSQGDQDPQPYPGINLGVINDVMTKNSIDFKYPAGPVIGNSRDAYTYTGTLNADFNPIILRLSGTFSTIRADARTAPSGVVNVTGFLNPRLGQTEGTNGTFNLKMTHIINPDMFYEVSAGYFVQTTERFDRDLKDNIWAYGDSVANAAYGWTFPSRWQAPLNTTVYGFEFASYGALATTYAKNDRRSITLNGSFNWKIGKLHDIKIGGEFQQYTLRNWGLSIATDGLASQLNTAVNSAANQGKSLDEIKRNLLRIQGVTAYGYDEFGNDYDGDGFLAPHKPVFASGYIQDKMEYEDLVLNLGLRLDYIDVDNLKLKDPSRPEAGVDKNSGELKADGWEKVPTYMGLSPRLGFSFPVTDRTFFHAQFGQFIQQTQLIDIYEGYYRTSYQLRNSFFFGSPVGKNIRPTRTTQYEIGFTQQLTDFLSFDINGYYKDIKDQVVFVEQRTAVGSPFQAYTTLANGDFATTKGLEITLNMRRYERLLASASISFQDARGTGSSPNSNRGIIGAPVENRVFTPKYISPLEFNNAVRGNVSLDYRFGPNDGPAALHNFGVSVLMEYSSGHPYTRGDGADDLEGDARNRYPIEALNSSTTPSTFQVDLRIDKTFRVFDQLGVNIYVQVINLFDAKNIENVFLRTGSASDDGIINDPERQARFLATYGPKYLDMYKAINIDYSERYQDSFSALQTSPLFYGPPRQIRLGLRLEY
jgi:hypothetical protein